jgi:hypothetical protein
MGKTLMRCFLCLACLLGTAGAAAAGPAQSIGAVSNPTAAGTTMDAPTTGISPASEEPRQARFDRNFSLCMSGYDGCDYDALTDEQRTQVLSK